jgi:hypothetical protein
MRGPGVRGEVLSAHRWLRVDVLVVGQLAALIPGQDVPDLGRRATYPQVRPETRARGEGNPKDY